MPKVIDTFNRKAEVRQSGEHFCPFTIVFLMWSQLSCSLFLNDIGLKFNANGLYKKSEFREN